jgi:hypothetical protein
MSGFKQPGLACEKCGKPFPLSQGVADWLGSLDKLDDPGAVAGVVEIRSGVISGLCNEPTRR